MKIYHFEVLRTGKIFVITAPNYFNAWYQLAEIDPWVTRDTVRLFLIDLPTE